MAIQKRKKSLFWILKNVEKGFSNYAYKVLRTGQSDYACLHNLIFVQSTLENPLLIRWHHSSYFLITNHQPLF